MLAQTALRSMQGPSEQCAPVFQSLHALLQAPKSAEAVNWAELQRQLHQELQESTEFQALIVFFRNLPPDLKVGMQL